MMPPTISEFPDKKRADTSYTHNLRDLVRLTSLEGARRERAKKDPGFETQSWSEQSRYGKHEPKRAKTLVRSNWQQPSRSNGVDKAVAASADLDVGAEILKVLDEAQVTVSAAFWASLPEYEDWRLALSSRELDSAGPREAYTLINRALAKSGWPIEKKPAIAVLPRTDPSIRGLRRMFGKTRSVEGMRIGGQMIGVRSSRTSTFIESLSSWTIRYKLYDQTNLSRNLRSRAVGSSRRCQTAGALHFLKASAQAEL